MDEIINAGLTFRTVTHRDEPVGLESMQGTPGHHRVVFLYHLERIFEISKSFLRPEFELTTVLIRM